MPIGDNPSFGCNPRQEQNIPDQRNGQEQPNTEVMTALGSFTFLALGLRLSKEPLQMELNSDKVPQLSHCNGLPLGS
jgi:hypothetical protein